MKPQAQHRRGGTPFVTLVRKFRIRSVLLFSAFLCAVPTTAASPELPLREQLDRPLLFVKRHPYFSDHIYDDYYTWRPGGGIYIIENPWAPHDQQKIRAVIDPKTVETLGAGVYRDPDISWDGKRLLFAFKGSKDGDTSIYEIGINGRGLRRLSDPGSSTVPACIIQPPPRALGKGRHDISPAYLPDGRIVFTSTRQGSRVPCFNSDVDNLHIMNADGSGVQSISVNNVTEFDPTVMPDGRILYGRWEYVDKTALYIQSLWTSNPDGSGEAAFFGNNMAKPTAFLDARPVPGSHLVVVSLTPHNGQSVGAIAMIDSRLGKNGLQAIANLTPEYPTEMDQGLKRGPCDPWPLDANTVLIVNNSTNFAHGVIQIICRDGRRDIIRSEPNISCYSPMIVGARPVPPVIAPAAIADRPAAFFVENIYEGLPGVERGEVTTLRVLEETARVSGIPEGGRWWNQAFLVSWQGAYSVKSFLGIVPVEADGSVHFEAPPGKALYFQALGPDGRMVQSMRTFVQATPGVTRSCIGCHETKDGTPQRQPTKVAARATPAAQISPESWGTGYVDYPTMIQPIFDRHCVSCHGGTKGIAGGIDLTGGWTWAFNISYETILKNTLSGFLNCVNEAVDTTRILPPRTHGSGVAPLAKLLLDGHDRQITNVTRAERDLLFAWMDGNCNYYGTWNWSEQATCNAILDAGNSLGALMGNADCLRCHEAKVGNDWINLQHPELSRILRAPLAADTTNGLEWCRDRNATASLPLVKQSAQPPDVFKPRRAASRNTNGTSVVTFRDTDNGVYREMLAIIRRAQAEALASPRVDMPGADIHPGETRQLVAPPLPARSPALEAELEPDGVVALSWQSRSDLIGLRFEIHRAAFAHFKPSPATKLALTPGFHFVDATAPAGAQQYALVLVTQNGQRGDPIRASVTVPEAIAPPAPTELQAIAQPGQVNLEWQLPQLFGLKHELLRASAGGDFTNINAAPIAVPFFNDTDVAESANYKYAVRCVSRRGIAGPLSAEVTAAPLPEPRGPIFAAAFRASADADLSGGASVKGKLTTGATITGDALDLTTGGHVTYPYQPGFSIRPRLSVECWVNLNEAGDIPVVLSIGRYDGGGWFLQKFGSKWRWHVGGLNCDGGDPALKKWTHLAATFDGRVARLFQNGVEVASVLGAANDQPWNAPLFVGQYGAEPAPKFQVNGRIAGVKIHRRALPAEDVLAAARTRPPVKEFTRQN